jgi:hypothetical protein
MATEAQCDSCGETNAPGSSFCLFCGAYLGWDQPGAGPSGGATAPPPAGQGAAPAPPATEKPAPAATTAALPPVTPTPTAGPSTASPQPSRDTGRAATPPGNPCPSCGHANDAGRRFCARCGFTLVAAARPTSSVAPAPRQRTGGWWPWGNSEERAARRAYRRSLPPLYRWRRVLVTLLVLAIAVAVVAVVEGNPIEWGRDRYYDIVDKKDPVGGVRVFEEPGGRQTELVSDTDPSTLWTMPWPGDSAGTDDCGADIPRLRFDLPAAVRVRGFRVQPGKRAEDTTRLLSPRPATLLVWWDVDGGERVCAELPVADEPASRDLEVDTEVEVDTVWVSVGSVHPAKNATEERPVAIRKLEVLARP